jgi:hypothetical protein
MPFRVFYNEIWYWIFILCSSSQMGVLSTDFVMDHKVVAV